jgi:hypothetical protein
MLLALVVHNVDPKLYEQLDENAKDLGSKFQNYLERKHEKDYPLSKEK